MALNMQPAKNFKSPIAPLLQNRSTVNTRVVSSQSRLTRQVSCELNSPKSQVDTAEVSRRACIGLAVSIITSTSSSALAKQLNLPTECTACCDPNKLEKCDARGWPTRVPSELKTGSDGTYTLMTPQTWNVMDAQEVLQKHSKYEGTWYYAAEEKGPLGEMQLKDLYVPKKAPYDSRISLGVYTKPTTLKGIEDLGNPEAVAELLTAAAHIPAQAESDLAVDIKNKGKILSAGSFKVGDRTVYEIHFEVMTSGNFQPSPRFTDIRSLTVADGVLYQVRGTYPQWKFGRNTNWRGEMADLVTSLELKA
mmetsp:Transcript_12897/g.17634  ORF Transcript_12897/g.17634 Transcript_12897/m.17634 type:complete len:307 (-) Transcript_12897:154-1074(-)|eukprot:CAMPEP_0196579072 /NCGR_PEP_ID=MMETSP1081-20130531/17499_1 /TAXON_ID=36882 /ORGANISM="Pyramimonas amylifera, Strain CCMP720" /LENGTH=306 /DNA_ID=CAMNT_0041898521 /DNA_START=75 /DNA_END=995 /DNA_ORIENTATION=+